MSFLALASVSFSQVGIKGGFAFGVTIPDSKINTDKSYFHPGFNLGVTYNFSDNFRAEILFEGLFHSQKSNVFGATISSSSRVLPVTLGVDYAFGQGDFKPYIGFNLGSYSVGAKAGNGMIENSNTYFGMYPKAGVNYAFTDNILLDVAFKYHMYFPPSNNSSMQMLFGANFGVIYKF